MESGDAQGRRYGHGMHMHNVDRTMASEEKEFFENSLGGGKKAIAEMRCSGISNINTFK